MARSWLRPCGWILAVGLAVQPLSWGRCRAQDKELPPPRPVDAAPPVPPILPPNYGGYLQGAIPVSLVDVLKLATLANLDIVQAQLNVERARANLLRARAQFLPNLNLGGTYTVHDGQIQNTAGNVQTVDRDSLFVGLGPSMSLDISNALFGPDEARKVLEAARFGQLRVTNDTLLRVADAYFNVLRVRRRLARIDETLDFLTGKDNSPLRGGSKGLLPLIADQVKANSANPADQARVEADVVRLTEERIRALEEVRVAAAELSRLLHLDPQVFLLPSVDYRWPLPIPGEAWFLQPTDELVALALRSRPELAENQSLVEAAIARFRAAKFRPLLPTVVLNYAWGGFGGGPAIVGKTKTGTNVLGESGTIANFGTRDDLDISLVWRLQNMGLGNLYQIRDARLQVEQSRVFQLQIQDQVITQVVQSMEQVQRSKQRVDLTRAGLFDDRNRPTGALYSSIQLNFRRIFQGDGRALEVQDSIRRLSDVLDSYGNDLTDFDRARFRLLIALGMSPGALIDPQQMPLPCCPPTAPTPVANAPGSPGTVSPSPGAGAVGSPESPVANAPGSPGGPLVANAPGSPPPVANAPGLPGGPPVANAPGSPGPERLPVGPMVPAANPAPAPSVMEPIREGELKGVALPPVTQSQPVSALPPRRLP
jgi:outer membrane protein TolC